MSIWDKYTHCYYRPETMSCIDLATEDGECSIYKESRDDLIKRYPTAVFSSWSEFEALQKAFDKNRFSTVTEVDEDRFMQMIEVLPPDNWIRQGRVEMFQMCELTIGNWTSTFLKWDNRYFETTCVVRTKLPELVEKVKETFVLEALT